jgi:acetyl esterase
VYLHGGGFVAGTVASYTGSCLSLCLLTGCVVVAVDYPLAPEHPFPAALEACAEATLFVLQRGPSLLKTSPGRVVVAGDSAGGNLAASVCIKLRGSAAAATSGSSPPTPLPCAQVLLYPVTNLDLASETGSRRTLGRVGEEKILTREMMRFCEEHYLPPADEAWKRDEQRRHPLASPLHAPEEALRGLPPALIYTAEDDILRDEGEAFARRLEQAGTRVEVLHRFPAVCHGFLMFPCEETEEAFAKIAADIRKALGATPRASL